MRDTVTLYENHQVGIYDHAVYPREFRTVPWCTTHNSKRLGYGTLCEQAAWYSNQDKHQIDGQNCVFVDKLVEA